MKEKGNYFSKIALGAELPGEASPGLPLVEICGFSRLLVENHKGVIGYGSDRIVVKVSYGQLCIYGKCLMLAYMTKHQLVVTGTIDSVSVIRGSVK